MTHDEEIHKSYNAPRQLEDLEPLEENGLISVPIHVIRLAREKKLSASAIELASHIFALSTARGYCYAGNRYLAQCLGLDVSTERDLESSTRAVRKLLESLEQAGAISRDTLAGGGRSLKIRTVTVRGADCDGPGGADCDGPGGADCDGPAYIYKKKDKYIYNNKSTNAPARESIDTDDPYTVSLDDMQTDDVLLTYSRELPAGKAQWALQRGKELLEAWLVKKDPNTNRTNAESVQKAHYGKILKGWVLRELLKEISQKKGNDGHQSGKSGKRTFEEQMAVLWGDDSSDVVEVEKLFS